MASLIRPCCLLVESPILLVISIYVAFVSGTLYLLLTTFADVFEGQYGFSTTISGLSYLGLGAALIVAMVVFRVLGDRVRRQKPPRPESRLILMIWFSPMVGLGLFMYGWTTYYKVHWIVPMVSTAIIGFGVFFVLVSSFQYFISSGRLSLTMTVLLCTADAGTTVPRRLVWLAILCLGSRGQQPPAFSRQHFPAARWPSYVSIPRLWMGKHIAGIPRVGLHSSPCPVLQVRGPSACLVDQGSSSRINSCIFHISNNIDDMTEAIRQEVKVDHDASLEMHQAVY